MPPSDQIKVKLPPMTTVHVIDGHDPVLVLPRGKAETLMGALWYAMQYAPHEPEAAPEPQEVS